MQAANHQQTERNVNTMSVYPAQPESAPAKQVFGRPHLVEIALFLILLSGPPHFRERDGLASVRGELDLATLLDIGLWLLGALWVFYQLHGRLLSDHRLLRLHWIQVLALTFVATLTTSVLLSSAVFLSAYKVFQMWVMLLFGMMWTLKYGVLSTLRTLLGGYLLLAIIIILTYVLDPQLVTRTTWLSTSQTESRLLGSSVGNSGVLSLMGLILLLTLPLPKRVPRLFLLGGVGLLLFLFIEARTRSAYAAALLYMLFLVFIHPGVRRLRLFRRVLFALSPVAIMAIVPITEWVVREPDSVYTLSGRTQVWGYLVQLVFQHSPIVGMGFNSERVFTLSNTSLNGISSHNVYLSVFFGGGLVSLGMLILLLAGLTIVTVRLVLHQRDQPAAYAVAGLLIVALAVGLVSENGVLAGAEGFTFFMLISMISVLAAQSPAVSSRVARSGILPMPAAARSHGGTPDAHPG